MVPSETVIRSAQGEDTDLIHTLICELAEYEKLKDKVVCTPAILRSEIFEKNGAEVLIAECEGCAVGFALFFHNFSTFEGRRGIYMEDLFVRPQYRGRGIGKALIARVAALAVSRGCARFEWACLDWNAPSIEFYRSLGAVPMDEWTVYRLEGNALRCLAKEA